MVVPLFGAMHAFSACAFIFSDGSVKEIIMTSAVFDLSAKFSFTYLKDNRLNVFKLVCHDIT